MDEDENPDKQARVPKGQSGGAWKLKPEPPADGQPHREHRLVDKGAGEDGQLMAGCSLRNVTFQCLRPPGGLGLYKMASAPHSAPPYDDLIAKPNALDMRRCLLRSCTEGSMMEARAVE
eukprot:1153457-Pelagomonas_calceolata.AAC.3